jgi:catechol 2,3-dioxygenase-like lactoylglutathione lyase family enzyme
MKFEHYAINVEDSAAVADWYVANCGMKIELAQLEVPFMRFLSDETGRVVIELYSNKSARIPDYGSQHPLEYHLAFAVENVVIEKSRLMAAGCSFIEEVNPQPGTRLVMLRDPFGMSLQLCQRLKPFEI